MHSRSLVLLGMILACCMAYGQQGQAPSSLPTVQTVTMNMNEPAWSPQWIVKDDILLLIWEAKPSTVKITDVLQYYAIPKGCSRIEKIQDDKSDGVRYIKSDTISTREWKRNIQKFNRTLLKTDGEYNPNILLPPHEPYMAVFDEEQRLELRYVIIVQNGSNVSHISPSTFSVSDWGRGEYPYYKIVTEGKSALLIDGYEYIPSFAFSVVRPDALQTVFRPLNIVTRPQVTFSLLNCDLRRFPPLNNAGWWAAKGFEAADGVFCEAIINRNRWLLLWNFELHGNGNALFMTKSNDAGITWQKPKPLLKYSELARTQIILQKADTNLKQGTKEDTSDNGVKFQFEGYSTPKGIWSGNNIILVAKGPNAYWNDYSSIGMHSGFEGWYQDFRYEDMSTTEMKNELQPTHPARSSLVFWRVSSNFNKLPDYSMLVPGEDIIDYQVTGDGKKNIYVTYTRGKDYNHCSIWMIASHDGGKFWQLPIQLTDGQHADRCPSTVIYHNTLWIAFIRIADNNRTVQYLNYTLENSVK